MKKITAKLFPFLPGFLVTAILLLCNIQPASAQADKTIGMAIDSSQWVFTPMQAMPTVGRTRQLTAGFSVTCKGSKLVVYLPYFGRAEGGADVLSGKGPLDFSSSSFSLNKLQPKPGQWSISIRPKDYQEVQSMTFIFFNNGSASLDIIMTNRSGIQYNGTVEPAR